MTIKDAFQFGIEPVRITDTDNIQVNEGLPTNADPQVYALQLAKTVKAMLNGVLKDAQENIPFPVEVLPTRNSLPTPIIAHTLADRSVVVPVRGGIRFDSNSPVMADVQEEGKPQLWNHKQNDALGLYLDLLIQAINTGTINAEDWQKGDRLKSVALLIAYLDKANFYVMEDS